MTENKQPSASIISVLPASVILVILGLSGLLYSINYNEPFAPYRWLGFFSGVLTITGLMLPISAFLNQRFPTSPPASNYVILRQALWPGIYLSTMVWLILGDVFSLIIAVLLALGMILIEWLLRLRERSEKRKGVKEEQGMSDK